MSESQKRYVEVVVHRLPHERAPLLLDADHGHRLVLDLERLADRVASFEEFFFHLRPDYADRRGVFDLVGGDEAALGEWLILHVKHIGRYPAGVGGELFLALVVWG